MMMTSSFCHAKFLRTVTQALGQQREIAAQLDILRIPDAKLSSEEKDEVSRRVTTNVPLK